MRSEEEIREKLKKLQSDMHYTLNNETIKVGIFKQKVGISRWELLFNRRHTSY